MAAFGDYFGQALQGIGGLGLAQQQARLGAYTASGTDWTHATQTINLDFNATYASLLGRPMESAPRGPETALEWLDRRVSEVCVKL